MAKIELINYTDRIGNPLYYVRIDGRQVEESETSDYAQAIRFYNYAVNNKGEESYEVVRHSVEQEDNHHEDLAKAGWSFDDDFEYDEAKINKALQRLEKQEETESKLWAEWSSRPNWAPTESFQDFVNRRSKDDEQKRGEVPMELGSVEENPFSNMKMVSALEMVKMLSTGKATVVDYLRAKELAVRSNLDVFYVNVFDDGKTYQLYAKEILND